MAGSGRGAQAKTDPPYGYGGGDRVVSHAIFTFDLKVNRLKADNYNVPGIGYPA